MTGLARRQIQYLAAFAGFVVLSLTPILGLNLLVDPLWYFSGTRIGPKNDPLNERTSKINLIMRNRDSYDCLILGSSVTTLLDAREIRGYRCFNAAFSDARAEELVVYARYLRGLGVNPRLIIVDLGPADLMSPPPSDLQMPEFIRNGGSPAPAPFAYLSFDVFWFSIRSALGMVNHDRWYTREFVCRLTARADPLTPARALDTISHFQDFGRDSLAVYAELLDIWPQARKIGYISFVNAWVVAGWQKKGLLQLYLETAYKAADLFDEFYDFTAPSDITTDLTQSTDGLHYRSRAIDLIAARLSGDQNSPGFAVHERSYREFKEMYLRRVQDMPAEIVDYVNARLP